MTDTTLTPFLFEGQLMVRTVMVDGRPWFVGVDVCNILGMGNSRQALSRLDADERGVFNVDTLGGNQEVVIVCEAGVYRLIFTSRKPVAERFKRWLAHDVLPAIRKTGSYHGGFAGSRPSDKTEAALYVKSVNSATRAVNMIARIAGPRVASKNAPEIFGKVGIVLDLSRSAAFDQGELPFTVIDGGKP